MTEASRFDELWDLLCRTAADGEVTPDTVCRTAIDHLQVTAAAVTVPDGLLTAQTIGAHGANARRLEELQVTVGEGPSLDGLTSGFPVLAEDIGLPEYRTRWPLFTAAAADTSMRAVCVSPMRAGGARFGVLTLYVDRPGRLGPDRMADARTYARITMELLLGHARTRPRGSQDEPLQDLWFYDDRPEIHQATGMVAAQLDVDLATALLRIRGRAFAEGRLISEVALDVVIHETRFDEKEQV
jgi:hypothetical protein